LLFVVNHGAKIVFFPTDYTNYTDYL
jgi:hypothetical protein